MNTKEGIEQDVLFLCTRCFLVKYVVGEFLFWQQPARIEALDVTETLIRVRYDLTPSFKYGIKDVLALLSNDC